MIVKELIFHPVNRWLSQLLLLLLFLAPAEQPSTPIAQLVHLLWAFTVQCSPDLTNSVLTNHPDLTNQFWPQKLFLLHKQFGFNEYPGLTNYWLGPERFVKSGDHCINLTRLSPGSVWWWCWGKLKQKKKTFLSCVNIFASRTEIHSSGCLFIRQIKKKSTILNMDLISGLSGVTLYEKLPSSQRFPSKKAKRHIFLTTLLAFFAHSTS